ncbi:MAG TPA: ABC transporter ATP-binding protein [Caulobacterales bacterium]|nr:ABC transporter ATP-binding protein [Caulobacterales bacterium]
MSESVLEVDGLSVSFERPDGVVEAVNAVSLTISKGECLGIAGESGAGKSQALLAPFRLGPAAARVSGSVKLQGAELLGMSAPEMEDVRGKRVGFVLREAALTPHLTVEAHLLEMVRRHLPVRGVEAERHALEWMERARIPDAKRRLRQYPSDLSADTRLRVTIAMALLCEPALLIADDPTAALNGIAQAQILDLIDEVHRDMEMAVAFISRDLRVIARVADRVALMRAGRIVESGDVEEAFRRPRTDDLAALLRATPRLDGPTANSLPEPGGGAPVLYVDDVRVQFPVRRAGRARRLAAVDGVTFALKPGETLGVVGESGAGKSVLARTIAQLLPRDAGAVSFLGRDLLPSTREALRRTRRDMQIVLSASSVGLDPHARLGVSIGEPLRGFEPHLGDAEREQRIGAAMALTGLDPSLAACYPHELDAGRRQRASIARAMILNPRLLVCDDALSALDVGVQAQIAALLVELQRQSGVSMLFASRDLALAREISHSLLILYLGRGVEYGPTQTVLNRPRHPYTKALLTAALTLDPAAARARPRIRTVEDAPDPLDTHAGLRFLKSRVKGDHSSAQYRPRWLEPAPGHFVAEHDAAEIA